MKTINDLNFDVPQEVEMYTKHSTEIGIMISNYINSSKDMTKKKFAELVGKTPTDVTRWLSGSHNFTILTISLIEAKTGMSILKNLTKPQIAKYLNKEVFKLESEKQMKDRIQSLEREIERLKLAINKNNAVELFKKQIQITFLGNTFEENYGGMKNTLGGCIELDEHSKIIEFSKENIRLFESHGKSFKVKTCMNK